MSSSPSSVTRGIAIGLWVLVGLAFLSRALLPGSTGGEFLGPALLAAAVGITALLKGGSGHRLFAPRPWLAVALTLAAAILAFGIALTIIREGDRRSFLSVGFVTLLALVLSVGGRVRGRLRP